MDNLSQGVDRRVHLLLQPVPLALSRQSFLLQQKQAEWKAETPSVERSNTPQTLQGPPNAIQHVHCPAATGRARGPDGQEGDTGEKQ